MSESNSSTSLVNKIIDLAKYWPSVCFAFAAPSGYLLLGPKEHKVFILANPDLIEISPSLNPEIGLMFLYLSSIVLTAFLRAFLSPVQDWWYEKKVIRHRIINNPLWTTSKPKPKLSRETIIARIIFVSVLIALIALIVLILRLIF